RIYPVNDDVGTISVGTAANASISGPGAIARRTFSATAGQKVFVDVLSSSLSSQCGVLQLRDPDGNFVDGGCIINGTGFIDGVSLGKTGTYVIIVDPGRDDLGDVLLLLATATDQLQTTTIGGPDVTMTIAQAGAISKLTFSGAAGQQITVDAGSS